MPEVSVIMGIYNCADTLPYAIECILNQTFSDWELIMCDDGSTDGSGAICDEFAAPTAHCLLPKAFQLNIPIK